VIVSLDSQIAAVRAEADFAASYAATAAIDRLNSKGARQRAEALSAAVRTLESIAALQHFVASGPQTDVDDGACPDDPDGLHHVGCGCETSDLDEVRT
jgi:uncharacterized protein YciI